MWICGIKERNNFKVFIKFDSIGELVNKLIKV